LDAIAESLWAFIRDSQLSLPLNINSCEALKSWHPTINLPDTQIFWYETSGISYCRLRGMVQNQSEPEMMVGFFIEEDKIYSTKFGRVPKDSSSLIDSIIIQRYPIKVISVPGERNCGEVPRVFLYDESGESIKLNTIIDGFGIFIEGEFHMIKLINEPEVIEIPDGKSEVLSGISQSLGGDLLAAEFVLYNLLSKVQERRSMIGILPINLINISDPQAFISFISSLIRTVSLPLTINSLSSQNFTPTKNYENDELEPSPLQIPDNSLLILDETQLSSGQLNEQGIKNLQTLAYLIERQQLSYDFKYYKSDFQTDIKIISISNGRSLLKLPLFIAVRADAAPAAVNFTTAHADYIKGCSKIAVSMSEEIIKTAQDYFVNQRQSSSISEEEFHLLLTLTRYIAQSERKSSAEISHWEQAKSLLAGLKSRQTN